MHGLRARRPVVAPVLVQPLRFAWDSGPFGLVVGLGYIGTPKPTEVRFDNVLVELR